MCDYIISLNKFNNITLSMIVSLQISLRSSSFLTSHHTTWLKKPFLFTSLSHFHVINYSQIWSTPTSVTVLLLSQILSTCPMSWSQVVFRRRFVCDEIIYYTMTCSFVYPATVLGKFRRGCLLKSDMSSGDLESGCRGRLSIGNLQGHTPCALDWVPWDVFSSLMRSVRQIWLRSGFLVFCMIFFIITSVTVVKYFRAAPLGVHVCFRRHTSCWWERSVQQYALSECVCVWGMPRNLAPFGSQNIIISFKHLRNINMSLKTLTNKYILLSDIHQSQWCWADIIV